MIVCQKIQSIISTKNLQLLKAVKPKKNPNLSIGIFYVFITYLSTFFFASTIRRIGRLLNRL